MKRVIADLAAYVTSWRLLAVGVAIGFLLTGFLVNAWWSAILGAAGLLVLVLLIALAERQSARLALDIGHLQAAIAAIEDRTAHGEVRDDALINQVAALEKRFKQLNLSGHEIRDSPEVVTGRVGKLFSLARGYDVDVELVTVVVTCFNEAQFVQDAISSLKAQTFQHFCVLFVDDASTDDSVERALLAIDGDERFRILQHETNRGLSAARNTGLAAAESEFICFLDADDFFFPDNLETRLESMAGYEDDAAVVGVYSGVTPVEERVTFSDIGPSMPSQMKHDFHDYLSAAGSCPFNCHAPLLRLGVAKRFGGFDESMREGAEDWEFWQRILRHGYVFQSTPSILAVYRQKTGSMVRSSPGGHLREADRLFTRVTKPMDVATRLPGTPFVFDEPLGVYQAKLRLTERLLEFLGMAYLAQDSEQLDTAFEHFDGQFWPIAKRHIRVNALIDKGIRRAMGVDQRAFANMAAQALPIRRALLEQLEDHAAQSGQ